jgi:hypothetical protein
MRAHFRLLSLLWVPLACSLLAGCSQIGPSTIEGARFDYNAAIVGSFDHQMLLNLVRLRYQDSILFLDLTSVVASYQRQVTVGTSAQSELVAPTVTVGATGGVSWTESPTITYAPLQGEDFAKRLLAPIQPSAILLLSRSGWGLERLLVCAVQQLNEVPNGTSIGGIAPVQVRNFQKFHRVAVLLRELQEDGYIQLNTLTGQPDTVALTQGPTPLDDEARAKANEILTLLAIKYPPPTPAAKPAPEATPAPNAKPVHGEKPQPTASEPHAGPNPPKEPKEKPASPPAPTPATPAAPVATSPAPETPILLPAVSTEPPAPSVAIEAPSFPRSPATLTLGGRSILGVLTFLAQDVEVPREHVERGLVRVTRGPDGKPLNWHQVSGSLFLVHSSKKKPEHPFLAVQYRDYWFYIDDQDVESKGTYALVAQLFSLQAANASGQAPILTIPTR